MMFLFQGKFSRQSSCFTNPNFDFCYIRSHQQSSRVDCTTTNDGSMVPRWWRNRTGRPLSPLQIHQKIIWMLRNFQKTASEFWQRTPGTEKGSPISSKKLWVIKPRLWPRLNSSLLEAKNPRVFSWVSNNLSSWGSSGILQDKMGANNSSLTPLNYILKNWDRFDPQSLKKTHLVFLCDTAWPRWAW